MKHLLFATALAFLFYACNGDGVNQNDTGMEGTQTEMPDNTATDTEMGTLDQAGVQNFVQEAASGGMMEVQLGQMAQEKGASQEVKDFGAMMVRDHGQANQQLQTIAQGMQLTLPQTMLDKHQQHVTAMQNMTGAEFDRHYMSMMVTDHQEDITKFETAQSQVTDQALRGWIDQTLPVLRQHHQRAQEINQSVNANM